MALAFCTNIIVNKNSMDHCDGLHVAVAGVNMFCLETSLVSSLFGGAFRQQDKSLARCLHQECLPLHGGDSAVKD
jgi:hypothetical protein